MTVRYLLLGKTKSTKQLYFFKKRSNSKKRPNNVILGRIYENQILDMVEFGVDDLTSQSDFLVKFSNKISQYF